MIAIHATKKLFAKLPLDDQGRLTAKKLGAQDKSPATAINNALTGWHANLITVQRRNCIIMVHDATRFPLFMKCLVKTDFDNFNGHFEDTLMNTLLKVGASQKQLDKAAAQLAPCQFDTDCNRSVQGTMNQMKGDFEHMLWFDKVELDDVSSYQTGAWLADRPCTIKGQKKCVWPKDAMLELLSQNEHNDLTPKQHNNVMQFSNYRS